MSLHLPMRVHCVGSPYVGPQDVEGAIPVPVLSSTQGKGIFSLAVVCIVVEQTIMWQGLFRLYLTSIKR